MKNFKYYLERAFPYVASAFAILAMLKFNICFINNSQLVNALDGTVTMTALIIGFLGAILPVILGMKNESKFVKYVFEKDNKRLFLKYIKETMVWGMILAFLTIAMYFNDSFTARYRNLAFYFWVYLLLLFLFCTYRSLSNMLNLIFSRDNDYNGGAHIANPKEKSDEEIQLENTHRFD